MRWFLLAVRLITGRPAKKTCNKHHLCYICAMLFTNGKHCTRRLSALSSDIESSRASLKSLDSALHPLSLPRPPFQLVWIRLIRGHQKQSAVPLRSISSFYKLILSPFSLFRAQKKLKPKSKANNKRKKKTKKKTKQTNKHPDSLSKYQPTHIVFGPEAKSR